MAKKKASGEAEAGSGDLIPAPETQIARKGDHLVIDPETLLPALISQPSDSPARVLLELLFDKRNAGQPIAFLCEKAGLPFEDLIEAVEKYNIGVGRIGWSADLPKVMKDVAVDAQSSIVLCEFCFGTGKLHTKTITQEGREEWIEGAKPCPKCSGIGEVRKAGDKQARLLLFEAMGLVGKAKQPLVAIQQNFVGTGQQAAQVSFTQKLLEAGRKAQAPAPKKDENT